MYAPPFHEGSSFIIINTPRTWRSEIVSNRQVKGILLYFL